MTKRPRRPFDDVVLRINPDHRNPDHVRGLDEDDDGPAELTLAPTDPEADRARQRMRTAETTSIDFGNDADPPKRRLPDFQFSLRHLLLANVGLAVALAILRLVAPELVAGLLGVAAFAGLLAVQVWQPADPRAYSAAGALVLIYMLVAAAVLIWD